VVYADARRRHDVLVALERDAVGIDPGLGLVVAVGCVGVMTGAILIDPHFVHPERPSARAAADTFAAASALLVGYLVHGRFRQEGLVRHIVLSTMMLTLAFSNFLFSVGPAAFGQHRLSAGAPVITALIAAVVFAAGAFVPGRRVSEGRRGTVAYASVASALATVGVSWLVASLAGSGIDVVGLPSVDAFGETGDVLTSALQGAAAALFLVGALGYLAASRRDADALVGVFAIAGVFSCASRLEYAIASSPGSGLATSGSLLRLAFYAVLLGGAGAEIRDFWRHAADIAVLEERRRIARDLHDGLAQELAFVATQSRVAAQWSPDSARAQRISAAAERALDESRRAIAALTRPIDEPLDIALAQTAEEVAGRHNMRVTLDLAPRIDVSNDTREALLRVVREAITNAGRHGQARRVTVHLATDAGVVLLRVADNGKGFDPGDDRIVAGSFGLMSMRERVEALGGEFAVRSKPYGGGTEIEVLLP